MPTDEVINLALDGVDAAIVIRALRTSYTHTLDAIGACAGAPYGYGRPRTEPASIDGHVDRLDRIERMCSVLGYPIDTGRRPDAERFYAEQVAVWDAEQMLAGGGA